jgi:hypothetical protein
MELCDEIISKYSIETGKAPGCTFSGVRPDIKDTLDFCMMKSEAWSRIRETLIVELINNLKIYESKLDTPMYHSQLMTIKNPKVKINYTELKVERLFFETLMVQKYESKKGRYIYHSDAAFEPSKNRFRVLTYIWYLNDVEEGGETLFWDNYKIKPQKGKLVLFPASWIFPHSGLMPISNDKYILTGWVYDNSVL